MLDFLETLGPVVAEAEVQVQHAAIWLVTAARLAKKRLADLEASDPMIAMAVKSGEAVAAAHGIDVVSIENAGDEALKVALAMTAAMSAAPAAPAPLTGPTIASVLGALGCVMLLGLTACAIGEVAKLLTTPPGQLFCSIETAGGGSFVAGLVTDAAPSLGKVAPIAVIATNSLKKSVDDDCAQAAANVDAVSGVPVSPPPGTVPTVAVTAPKSNVAS